MAEKNKTSYQKAGAASTDEWYTPAWITDALGEFDLDPCAPVEPIVRIAKHWYTKEDDGTKKEWHGRVWLNPPYSNVEPFMEKMVAHGNGIAILFNRQDTKVWHKLIATTADAMLFMMGRVKFIAQDGSLKAGSTCGSVLIAWGEENVKALENSGLAGFMAYFKRIS